METTDTSAPAETTDAPATTTAAPHTNGPNNSNAAISNATVVTATGCHQQCQCQQ